jgi:hypothetical protein
MAALKPGLPNWREIMGLARELVGL